MSPTRRSLAHHAPIHPSSPHSRCQPPCMSVLPTQPIHPSTQATHAAHPSHPSSPAQSSPCAMRAIVPCAPSCHSYHVAPSFAPSYEVAAPRHLHLLGAPSRSPSNGEVRRRTSAALSGEGHPLERMLAALRRRASKRKLLTSFVLDRCLASFWQGKFASSSICASGDQRAINNQVRLRLSCWICLITTATFKRHLRKW